ncbi:hypothetical protein JI58_09275 [Marinosulfonomonas sp. PRT-SC04]|nr:hypothetical protein JI58_09275 [Marinosulfonomonas sp. PRT-SC04]
MSENKTAKPMDLGIYGRKGSGGITAAEIIALALSLLWVVAVILFFTYAPKTDGPDGQVALDPIVFVMKLMAIFLPIAVIWVGASAARSARIMRTESARLQAAIDAMRNTYIAQAQSAAMGIKPSVEKKLDAIAAAQKQTETAIATFTSIRTQPSSQPVAPKPAPTMDGADTQTSLALGTTTEDITPPIGVDDFIRALNFPENEDDREGFAALRRALQDRTVARLIQAAQDVLTLLSQEGIYMDDLQPDRARPEFWRKFAQGERGRAIADLGGVRDRSSLALTSGRMRQDPIFRDAVHHFLRQFDKTFSTFEANATDQEIVALSDTRTARAFMLLGRVTGTFD